MPEDDLMLEVRAAKESLAVEYGYSFAAIMEGMRKLDAADPKPTVKLPKPLLAKGIAGVSVPIKPQSAELPDIARAG